MKLSKILGLAVVDGVEEFSDLESLAAFIKAQTWSPFLFDGTERKAKQMIYCDTFAIDIDENLPLNTAIERLKTLGYDCVVGTSKSHGVDKKDKGIQDRFRVVFPLQNPIATPEEVKALFFDLLKLFPEMDQQCKDAARLYYPCKEIVFTQQEGKRLLPPQALPNTAAPLTTLVNNGAHPLSKKTMNLLSEGAPAGTRNGAFTAACHDAIQQGWTEEAFTDLLREGPAWMLSDEYIAKRQERFKNFTPTHPPRLSTASAQNQMSRAKRLEPNQVRAFMLAWLDNNEVRVSYNRTLFIGNNPYIVEDISRKIILCAAEANVCIDKALLDYSLIEWVEERREGHLEAVRSIMNSYDEEKGDKAVRAFLGVLKEGFSELDVNVFKHMLWQVKRKLFAKRTKYEMMFVMTGGQGAGKSTALRDHLFLPLGDLSYSNADFHILSDQRESRLLADHYTILFDEMSGAGKADMERTKQVITSGQLKQRRMGTTSHDYLSVNATFFGSSNSRLETLIRDHTGMRRFWEFYVDNKEITSKKWPLLKQMDPMDLWCAVDYNQETAPIEPYLDDITVEQEKLKDTRPIEHLLGEGVLALTQNEQEYNSATDIAKAVSFLLNQVWSTKSLSREWKDMDIPKVRNNKGVLYGIKIVDQKAAQSIGRTGTDF